MPQVALVVVVGGSDQRTPVPRQREDRPLLARRDDAGGVLERQELLGDRDVRPPAWRDPRHLLLGEDLLGPDPVRPHAGGVHHVGRTDLEALAAHGIRADDPRRTATSGQELHDLRAVHEHRAESLRLAEHREDQPDVVGLTVVEEVCLLGVAFGERGDELRGLGARDRAVPVRRPVLLGRPLKVLPLP